MTEKNSEDTRFKTMTDSLNQSGAFLQVYVQDQLKIRGWDTLSEYPIRFSPFVEEPRKHVLHLVIHLAPMHYVNSATFVKASADCLNKSIIGETSIDIVATKDKHAAVFNLCIESKKLDPRFTDWVFIQQEQSERVMRLFNRTINTEGLAELFTVPATYGLMSEAHLRIIKGTWKIFNHDVADFALALKKQEVERDYYKSEKTKIDESARQIIEGTYGYIVERTLDHVLKGEPILYNRTNDIFVPIVVTNANLYVCKFDVEKIDPSKASVKDVRYEQVDSIIYECAPPKTVQFPDILSSNLTPEQRKYVSKWHVLILSPKGLVSFLDGFDKQ